MRIKSVINTPAVVLTIVEAALVFAPAAQAAQFAFGHPGEAAQVNRTIVIQAHDDFFLPRTVTVKAGETIRFKVVNVGKLPHEFMLGDKDAQAAHEKAMHDMRDSSMPGMNMTNMPMNDRPMPGMSITAMEANSIVVEPGHTQALIWTFTKPETLAYGCHEPGHFAAGMVGTIEVQPASGL